MRLIKFRAWDKVDKKVRKVMSLDFYNTRQSEVTLANDGNIYLRYFEQVELMQYTGVKDKNGIEIYEGDIVNITQYFGGHPYGEIKYIIKGSEYNNNLVADRESDGRRKPEASISFQKSYDYEVIGNIHENPGLLKSRDVLFEDFAVKVEELEE